MYVDIDYGHFNAICNNNSMEIKKKAITLPKLDNNIRNLRLYMGEKNEHALQAEEVNIFNSKITIVTIGFAKVC